MENGLLSTPPERLGFAHTATESIPDTDADGNVEYPEARLEIENGLHQLETLLEATVDRVFDKFEIYVLRNILTVPEDLTPWVRLSHHEVCQLTARRQAARHASSLGTDIFRLHARSTQCGIENGLVTKAANDLLKRTESLLWQTITRCADSGIDKPPETEASRDQEATAFAKTGISA